MAFSQDTFRFLAELEANNSKDWFEAHRSDYETHWKDAALDFIAGLSTDMATRDPALRAEAKLNGSLRRINRDVRFSKDKSPYAPRLHIVFWNGDHPNRSPGVHIVLNPKGVGYGAGQFGLEPAALKRIRARIVGKDGDGLVSAFDAAATVGCRAGEPDLARLPKGFDAEGPHAHLLRYKSFVARTHDKDAPQDAILGEGARDWVLGVTDTLLPLVRWLKG